MSNCSWFYDNIQHTGYILCAAVNILKCDSQLQFPEVEVMRFFLDLRLHFLLLYNAFLGIPLCALLGMTTKLERKTNNLLCPVQERGFRNLPLEHIYMIKEGSRRRVWV